MNGIEQQSSLRVEEEITDTRERMADNIEALGDKLNPENLKQQAREAISEKAHEFVGDIEEQARQTGDKLVQFVTGNPLPVAAATLGAIWLFTKRNRSGVSGDRMARFAYTGPERRNDAAQKVRGAASQVADLATDAGERVRELGTRVEDQARRARGGLSEMVAESPLLFTAGVAVIGAALGMLLPDTRGENRLMGATRDDVVDRAEDTVRQVKDAAVDAGHKVADAVQEEIAARGPEVKGVLQESAKAIGQEVKESASKVVQEGKQAITKKG